jgi:hypothetical protein
MFPPTRAQFPIGNVDVHLFFYTQEADSSFGKFEGPFRPGHKLTLPGNYELTPLTKMVWPFTVTAQFILGFKGKLDGSSLPVIARDREGRWLDAGRLGATGVQIGLNGN